MEENQTTPEVVDAVQTPEVETNKKPSLVQRIMSVINGEGSGEDATKAKETTDTSTETGADATSKDTKQLTEADVQKAVEDAQAKWNAEQVEKERLSKLSPEERDAVENKKNADKIAELESKLLLKDLNEKAISDLSTSGYPVELASMIDFKDENEMNGRLETIKGAWSKCLEEALRVALKGKTPDGLGIAAKQENSLSAQVAGAIKGGI